MFNSENSLPTLDETGGVNSRPLLSTFSIAILNEMAQVLAERGPNYGDFEDNANVYYGMAVQMGLTPAGMMPSDVVSLNYILGKLSRLQQDPNHRDSWLDIIGYAVLALATRDRRQLGVSDNHSGHQV